MHYADQEMQTAIEYTHSKNHLMPRLKREFLEAGIEDHLSQLDIPFKFGLDLLVQMVLHKRAKLPVLVGLLKKHFDELQECADMIIKAAEVDLIDYEEMSDVFIMKIDVTEDVRKELAIYQFPVPMVVPPEPVNDNSDLGYKTVKGTILLGYKTHHDDDICLEHINRANAIPLTINEEVFKMVNNKWKSLDKKKEGEDFEKYQKRLAAFEKYTKDSVDVIQGIIDLGNKFHLTHAYDMRGRSYTRGYHINPQGNTWNKAIVEFANQEVIE